MANLVLRCCIVVGLFLGDMLALRETCIGAGGFAQLISAAYIKQFLHTNICVAYNLYREAQKGFPRLRDPASGRGGELTQPSTGKGLLEGLCSYK